MAIKEKLNDPERYQTVYAKVRGSAAAPTGLDCSTDEIFTKLEEKGVTVVDSNTTYDQWIQKISKTRHA